MSTHFNIYTAWIGLHSDNYVIPLQHKFLGALEFSKFISLFVKKVDKFSRPNLFKSYILRIFSYHILSTCMPLFATKDSVAWYFMGFNILFLTKLVRETKIVLIYDT